MPRQGERRAAVPQPARGGGAVVFGPQTQEEAALDAVSRRLRGRTKWLEAFAQAEVERTRDLERAVLVSLLVISSLWGRASAPTGCSPRGSGQLRSSWVESLECWPCSDFCFLQHLDAFRVAAYNRLLGKHRELMEQLAAKEEELRVAAGILVLFSSGGASAPIGCSPRDWGQLCNSWAKS